MRSPGLGDSEVSTLSQDPTGFYSSTMELGVYDRDPQTYQYYNRYLSVEVWGYKDFDGFLKSTVCLKATDHPIPPLLRT